MLKPAIQQPLTAQEVKELVQFLSYHLGYVPLKTPKIRFCQTAKEFAELYENYKVREPALIDKINKECKYFFDVSTETVVCQGFSYHNGIEIPTFIIPMGTIVHELIHFFQCATGTYGSYRILYEGVNDILSYFLVNDGSPIDYKIEAVNAFNLIMELVDHDFWSAIDWMKKFTLHSTKNRFVHHEVKTCPTFSKYNPRKLLTILDKNDLDAIENEDVKEVLTQYSLKNIENMCNKNRAIIQL